MSYRPIIISSHLVIISSHHDIISSHHVTILSCVLDISQIMSMVQFFSISQSTRSPSGFHLFVCLLLFEIFDFRKVYWSPRFVTFRNLDFRKVYCHRCLSVCLSVCLFVCLSVRQFKALYRPYALDCPIVLIFLHKMSSGHATMQNFFFWKSDKSARSRSPLLWKSDNWP